MTTPPDPNGLLDPSNIDQILEIVRKTGEPVAIVLRLREIGGSTLGLVRLLIDRLVAELRRLQLEDHAKELAEWMERYADYPDGMTLDEARARRKKRTRKRDDDDKSLV